MHIADTYRMARIRSSRGVRASDSQCRSRNCSGFDPSILQKTKRNLRGRQMKQYWILYIKIYKKNSNKSPFKNMARNGNAPPTYIINEFIFSFSLTLLKKKILIFPELFKEVLLARSQVPVLLFFQNQYFISFVFFYKTAIRIFLSRPLLTCRKGWLIDGAVTAIWLLHCFHSSTQLKMEEAKNNFNTSFWDSEQWTLACIKQPLLTLRRRWYIKKKEKKKKTWHIFGL